MTTPRPARFLSLAASLSLTSLLAGGAMADSVNFQDAGDGTWENTANWTGDVTDDDSNGALPDSNDRAYFEDGQTVTLSSAQSVDRFYVRDGATLNIESGGSLTTAATNNYVGSSTSGTGAMNITGSVNADGYRVIAGSVATLDGGTITAPDRMYVEGSTLNILGSAGTINAGFLRLYIDSFGAPVLNYVFDENGVTPINLDGAGEVGLDYLDGALTESASELHVDLSGLTGLGAGTFEYTLINGKYGLSTGETFAVENITGVDGTYLTAASVIYDTGTDDVLLSVTSSGVPEPASLMLMGLGGCLLMGRRKSGRGCTA